MRRLQRHHRGRIGLAVLGALLLVAGLPAAASAERGGHLAQAAVHADGVDFLPRVSYSRAELTIAGNGEVYRYHLAAGEPLALEARTPDGEPLADGHYNWQLELVPPAAVAEQLRADALAGGDASLAWWPQSGSFSVLDGRLLDPSEREPLAEIAAQGPEPSFSALDGGQPTPAADVDGARGGARFATAAPDDATAALASAASRLAPDADSAARAQLSSADEEQGATAELFQPSLPQGDPARDAANGRSDLYRKQ